MISAKRIRETGVVLCAVAAIISAGDVSVSQAKSKHGPYAHPSMIGGTPVPRCNSKRTHVTTVVRVRIHDSIDQLLGPTPDRRVYYKSTLPDIDSDNDAQEIANSTNDLWSDPQDTNTIVPYSVDFTTMGLSTTSQHWIKVKVLILDNSSNMKFYDGNGVYGVTVDNPDVVSNGDVCYWIPSSGKQDHRLVFFIRSPQSHQPYSAPRLEYSFNIAIVGKTGAVTTPISIDPKIMNNG